MTLMNRLKHILMLTAGMLCALPFTVYGLQGGSDVTQNIRGFYPVIDEVAAYSVDQTWRVGMTITIPNTVTPVLGPANDGENGIYAFIDRDLDDQAPVPYGIDLSHSTINWYVLPKGVTKEQYDGLRRVTIGLNLSGPVPPGQRVLIGTGSSIQLPMLALGNQIGFDITPKTSIGNPKESPKIIVTDARFLRGQIDPNAPDISPLPDPELPLVNNPGLPPEEIPEDPTLGQPKIYIFRKDEWELLGQNATPIDSQAEDGIAQVEVDTEYVARVLRDEYIPYTATLADDTDVTDRIEKPLNWYLYSFENDQLIPNAIETTRLSFYNGIANGMYKTQATNLDATVAAKQTSEKSEQKLRLRAGFLWDPEDTDMWPEPSNDRPIQDVPSDVPSSDEMIILGDETLPFSEVNVIEAMLSEVVNSQPSN